MRGIPQQLPGSGIQSIYVRPDILQRRPSLRIYRPQNARHPCRGMDYPTFRNKTISLGRGKSPIIGMSVPLVEWPPSPRSPAIVFSVRFSVGVNITIMGLRSVRVTLSVLNIESPFRVLRIEKYDVVNSTKSPDLTIIVCTCPTPVYFISEASAPNTASSTSFK